MENGRINTPVTCVHIITRMDRGGSAENTLLTVRHLAGDRYHPVLITGPSTESQMSEKERTATEDEIRDLREHGIPVMVCPLLYRRISLWRDPLAFIWLLAALMRLKPQIVHTHTSKAGILGRWAAFFNRVPVICHTPHGHVFYGYFGPLKRAFFIWLERLTSRITDRIICLTEGEMADHIAFGIAPEHAFLVCPSGVDIESFKKNGNTRIAKGVRRKLGIPKQGLVVGTVGRHVKVKGHEVLLAAFRRILEKRPDALLCLLGDGPLKEDLERIAREWEIMDRVRFIPWETDPRPVMSLYDIFVFPSLNEGMGRALVEAMAMAKPVIATRTGGIPDLVQEGVNGILVPPGDESSLADAMLTLAERPWRMQRMGEMSETLAERFSLRVMMDRIERLYGSLLAGDGKSRGACPSHLAEIRMHHC
ncbi:MAG: glycosyltransferase family 4 protein [bacterium]